MYIRRAFTLIVLIHMNIVGSVSVSFLDFHCLTSLSDTDNFDFNMSLT